MTEPGLPQPQRQRPPAELEDLVGDNLSPEELAELRPVDSLLRSVPAPPEVPARLRAAAPPPAPVVRLWTPRRALAAVALAAALSALFFGLGARTAGDAFSEQAAVPMAATGEAPGAAATLRLGESDGAGNRELRLSVDGLEPLPEGGYYVLWLEKDGEYAGTCGTFAVAAGETEAAWTISYDLDEFDAWVVSARVPGQDPEEASRVLEAAIDL